MLRRAAGFAWRIVYARYLLASAVALGADLACFFLLLGMHIAAVPASMAGYLFGLGVHWLLSSRLVFAQEGERNPSDRMRQKLLFIASALVGLAITAGIVGIGNYWGVDPRLAKLVAVGISFQATYLLRRTIVFA